MSSSSFLSNLTSPANPTIQNQVSLPSSSSSSLNQSNINIMDTLMPLVAGTAKFAKAMAHEIQTNPDTRAKVKQLVLAGATMIHQRNLTKVSSQSTQSTQPVQTTQSVQPVQPVQVHVQSSHKESVKLNETTYSGSTMRKLLASLLIVGIGAVVTYLKKDELEHIVNKFTNTISLDSVMALLTRISIDALRWAATTKDAAAKQLKKWLKTTKTSVKLSEKKHK